MVEVSKSRYERDRRRQSYDTAEARRARPGVRRLAPNARVPTFDLLQIEFKVTDRRRFLNFVCTFWIPVLASSESVPSCISPNASEITQV